MPANRRSLQITNLYGRRIKALSRDLANRLGARWRLTGDFDAQYAEWLAYAIPATTAAQTLAVQITSGYLGAFRSSEAGRVLPPPRLNGDGIVGRSRDGRPLAESLDSPLIKAKLAVGEGKSTQEASKIGFDVASRSIRFDTDEAARLVMSEYLRQNDNIIGYRRVSGGESTCGGCLAAESGEVLLPTEDFASHPGCDCVAEPVYGDVDDLFRHPTGQQKYDSLTPEEKVEAVGLDASQLIDSGEIRLAQLEDRFETELGPNFLVERPLKDVV